RAGLQPLHHFAPPRRVDHDLRGCTGLGHAPAMIRARLRYLAMTSVPLLASACFEDPATSTETGTETGDGDGDPGDGDPGDGDPDDGDGEPGDGDGEPGDGDGEPGDGDGEADPGPQIVSSTPNSDDQNAGLDPYFLLYFDR